MSEQDALEPISEVLAETGGFNYSAWKVTEPDGEVTYQLQLNNVTIHFFQEEWVEFLTLAAMLPKK
jgi:hypothetical protein